MSIAVGKDFRITTDRYNIILEERKETKPKKDADPTEVFESKEYWITVGFYPSFQAALKALVDKEIMGLDDLRLIVNKQKELYKLIEESVINNEN